MNEFISSSAIGLSSYRARSRGMAWRLGIALCLLLFGLISAHAALVPLAAIPGQTVVLVESSSVDFDNVSATAGKAMVVTNPKDSKKYDLVFTPDPTNTAKTVAVSYTPKGGATTTTLVAIQPDTGMWGDAYGPVFSALFALFVVALLLEAALSLLFNWRVFLMLFDAKGAKTFFSFAGAFWLVQAFELDVMQRIVSLLWNPNVTSDWVTKILSAMVLAGGSSAVNNLMVALGFRSVRNAGSITPKPPPSKAWVSVHLTRVRLPKEPITLHLKSDGGAYMGIYRFNSYDRRWSPLKWLVRDPLRFPAWGGFPVEPGIEYRVKLEGPEVAGGKPLVIETPPFTLAAGAILDIEEKL